MTTNYFWLISNSRNFIMKMYPVTGKKLVLLNCTEPWLPLTLQYSGSVTTLPCCWLPLIHYLWLRPIHSDTSFLGSQPCWLLQLISHSHRQSIFHWWNVNFNIKPVPDNIVVIKHLVNSCISSDYVDIWRWQEVVRNSRLSPVSSSTTFSISFVNIYTSHVSRSS